jgi:hypothetical protein
VRFVPGGVGQVCLGSPGQRHSPPPGRCGHAYARQVQVFGLAPVMQDLSPVDCAVDFRSTLEGAIDRPGPEALAWHSGSMKGKAGGRPGGFEDRQVAQPGKNRPARPREGHFRAVGRFRRSAGSAALRRGVWTAAEHGGSRRLASRPDLQRAHQSRAQPAAVHVEQVLQRERPVDAMSSSAEVASASPG